jgi:hypothetical protein
MIFRMLITILLLIATAKAEPVVPSTWEGSIKGSIRGRTFEIPISIELRLPMPYEHNPFHLSIGTTDLKRIGDIMLSSAGQFNTSTGRATLQYFEVVVSGSRVLARLTETNSSAAAAINIFMGPNISYEEASDLMKIVFEGRQTELFAFLRGVVVDLQFGPDEVTGSISGEGRAATNTTSNVKYTCGLRARRAK